MSAVSILTPPQVPASPDAYGNQTYHAGKPDPEAVTVTLPKLTSGGGTGTATYSGGKLSTHTPGT